MGLGLQAIGWVVETGSTISKRTHLALLANLALVATAGTCAWLLGRWLGFRGVALGVCCGYLAYLLTTFALARRAWSFPWNYPPVIGVILITLATGATQFLAARHAGHWAGAAACLLGMLGLAAFSWFVVFDPQERRALLARLGSHEIRGSRQ
jgi:O-antigen/teichoic acid export membrane protein